VIYTFITLRVQVFLLEQHAQVESILQGQAAELVQSLIHKRGLEMDQELLIGSTPLHMAGILICVRGCVLVCVPAKRSTYTSVGWLECVPVTC